MKKLSLLALTAALSTTIIGPAAFAADDERAQAVTETRQGLLKVMGYYLGPIVGMARQQIPYDADMVQANAEKIAALAPMIPDVFRTDTRENDVETEALDGIWENAEDFAAKAATTGERATALAAAAQLDQGSAMKAFGALGGSCKSCHDDYRQQQ